MTVHEIKLKLHKCELHASPRVTIRRGDNGTQKVDALIEDAGDYPAGTICRFKVLHQDGTWAQSDALWDGSHAVALLTSDVLNGNGPCRLAYFEFVIPPTDETDAEAENEVETTSNVELLLLQNVDVTAKQARGYNDEFERLYKELTQMENKLEKVKNDAIVATNETITATKDTKTATNYASAATTKANIATDNATEAAEKANTAADRVDTAIADVSNVIERSETATTNANTATANAKAAATLANETNENVKTAEAARVIAEEGRVEAEKDRVIEFNEIIEQLSSLKIHLCEGGEYDETTRKPTIVGEPYYIYLTPAPDESANDHYYEWIYFNDTFEKIGNTSASYEAITTDVLDAILDGQTKTGSEVLNTTGTSYLYSKLTNKWAEKDHTHVCDDITDLGKGALCIKQGSIIKGTFNANSADDVVVTIDEYVHPDKDGWHHLPNGGQLHQYLACLGEGKGEWVYANNKVTENDSAPVTSGGVYNAIGRGTLTIKQGNTTKGTFSANAESNVEVKIDEYEHPTTAGWKHIPTGGTTGSYLEYAGTSGTAQWTASTKYVTQDSTNLVTSGGVYDALEDYAPLQSPNFTGTPTAPTPAADTTITTTIATVGFVADAINTAITEVENGSY